MKTSLIVVVLLLLSGAVSLTSYVLGFNKAYSYALSQQADYAQLKVRSYEHIAFRLTCGEISTALKAAEEGANAATIFADATIESMKTISVNWFFHDPGFYFSPDKYSPMKMPGPLPDSCAKSE